MIEQYLLRFKKLRVACKVWFWGMRISEAPSNLIVILETTEIPALRTFIENLTKHRMARIIIDEAHLIVGHRFRLVTGTLAWLGTLAVPIILQSATIPPTMTAYLCSQFGITDWQICRATTPRANISYQVEHVDNLDLRLKQLYVAQAPRKMLVFCSSRAEVNRISAMLDIRGCSSAKPPEEVDDNLQLLRSGSIIALASTSLLGVALDVPDIELVVHYGNPWNILSYSQETGRGGRAPDASARAIVLVPRNTVPRPITMPDFMGAALLKYFIADTRHCRRWAISLFIDGIGVTCSMLVGRVAFCDVCFAQSNCDVQIEVDYNNNIIAPYLPRQ